jgi:hypothetical protein
MPSNIHVDERKDDQTNARLQLSQQDSQILQAISTVHARGVQHEHEHARTLDVPEKQVAQPSVLVRALYDSRQVGDGERLRVVEPSHKH